MLGDVCVKVVGFTGRDIGLDLGFSGRGRELVDIESLYNDQAKGDEEMQ